MKLTDTLEEQEAIAVAVELFGMGITPCHHGGALGAHFAHPPRQAHSRHPAQDRRQRGTRGGIRLATELRTLKGQSTSFPLLFAIALAPDQRCPYRKLKTADRDRESADSRS